MPPAFGPPPPPGAPPAAPRARGVRLAATAGAAAVVVAALVAGGLVVMDRLGSDREEQGRQPVSSATPTQPGDEGSDGPEDAAVAEDELNGISLPLLEGWEASSGGGVTSLGTGEYPCPATPELTCLRGGVSAQPAQGFEGATAEEVAKEDIAVNAELSYGTVPGGSEQPYGGVASHKEVRSRAVTVAGERGYLVRWRVETGDGTSAYVQSVAFPSPRDHESMVLLRFGFDRGGTAPTVADMTRIVDGIKPLTGSGRGPGDGQAV